MSRNGIPGIVAWLEGLQKAAGPIKRAGTTAGANQAAASGLRASADADKVTVALRGRRPLGPVPMAMRAGMLDEFNRRAK